MKTNTSRIKAGIFSPYIDMFGGGERYLFSIAAALSKNCEVYLYADDRIKKESVSRFGISLENVRFLPANLLKEKTLLGRYNYLSRFDLFIYMTDGSLFFSGAKNNLLIIQSPLHIPKANFLNNLKLSNWKVICYSQFMKAITEKKLGKKVNVSALAPCIDVPENLKSFGEKENIILTVGRFFPYPHDKKQGMLIDCFKDACRKFFPGWKLIIAGGLTEEGGKEILSRLKEKTKGIPVEVKVNLSSTDLLKIYQKAKIYWHATGFGENLDENPQKAEHFGIAPLEAMAYGGVPLVYNGGGLKDIITEGNGGYLWNTKNELIEKTYKLVQNNDLLGQQAVKAHVAAGDYSCDKFYGKLEKIIAE